MKQSDAEWMQQPADRGWASVQDLADAEPPAAAPVAVPRSLTGSVFARAIFWLCSAVWSPAQQAHSMTSRHTYSVVLQQVRGNALLAMKLKAAACFANHDPFAAESSGSPQS